MPYVFAVLVVANAGLLGYFIFVHDADDKTTIVQTESAFTHEIDFKDTSEFSDPIIGKK